MQKPYNRPTSQNQTLPIPNIIQYPLKNIQYKNAIYYGDLDQRLQPHNVGIYLYDNGDFAVYNLQHGKIDGNFFYFSSSGKGACFYGSMRNNKLHGTNFVYSRKDAFLKCQFWDGSLRTDDYTMKSKFKSFVVRENQRIKERFSIQQTTFIKPTDFLMEFFGIQMEDSYSFFNHSEPGSCFQIYQLAENQIYFGTTINEKPHGIGIVFLNQWPVCYGQFSQGKLHGLGRIYETPLLVIDGIFEKSNLQIGWMIDMKEDKSIYGRKSESDSKIQIFQSFQGLHFKRIETFRKSTHLTSLLYNNNYVVQKNPHVMWPSHLLSQILYEQVIQDILHNYNPLHISEIQRVAEDSDNNRTEQDLVDLIKEHNEQKQSHIQISQILASKLKTFEEEVEETVKKPMEGDRKLLRQKGNYSTTKTEKQKLDLHKIYRTYLKK